MLQAGGKRESTSPYSNVVPAKKSDDLLRFCIDLRNLNDKAIKQGYHLHTTLVDDTINTLK